MKKRSQLAAVLALIGLMAIGGLAVAPETDAAQNGLADVSAVSCPVVAMKHWQASSRQEKLAFLFGLASMLELERSWQQGQELPVDRSINQSWVRGFAGKTIGDIADALDAYAANNPDKQDEPVLRALGRMYVRPALTPAELKAAGDRYERIKRSR